MAKLPTVPEEITTAWLSSVLGHPVKATETTNAVLVATTCKISMKVTYEDEDTNTTAVRPSNICIKGGFNPPMQAPLWPLLIVMYKGEVSFFQDVAPTLPPSFYTPKVWWAGAEGDDQAIIIMDDLVASGHSFGDAAITWPVARVRQTVEQLAALHAATWNRTSVGEVKFNESTHYEGILLGLCQMWEESILAADRPPLPEDFKNQDRIVAILKKHFASRNPRFLSFIHGDAHVGNTFLAPASEADGDDVAALEGWKGRFLDWQTTHVGSAFHDVAYFIGGSLTIADRRAHELDLLDHYLATLAQLGGPKLSRTDDPEVMVEYRKSTLAGWGWLVTPFHTQSVKRVFAIVERFVAQMQDHDTLNFVESHRYHTRMLES
jgi:aminoglycoside phosphotransferase (APT) family kinase protein